MMARRLLWFLIGLLISISCLPAYAGAPTYGAISTGQTGVVYYNFISWPRQFNESFITAAEFCRQQSYGNGVDVYGRTWPDYSYGRFNSYECTLTCTPSHSWELLGSCYQCFITPQTLSGSTCNAGESTETDASSCITAIGAAPGSICNDDPAHCSNGVRDIIGPFNPEAEGDEDGIDCGGDCSAPCVFYCPTGTHSEQRVTGDTGVLSTQCVSDTTVDKDALGKCPGNGKVVDGVIWVNADGQPGKCAYVPVNGGFGYEARAGFYEENPAQMPAVTDPTNPWKQTGDYTEQTDISSRTVNNPDGSISIIDEMIKTGTGKDGAYVEKKTTETKTNADGSKSVTETITRTYETGGPGGESRTETSSKTTNYDAEGNVTGESSEGSSSGAEADDGTPGIPEGEGEEAGVPEVDAEYLEKYGTRWGQFTTSIKEAPLFEPLWEVFEGPSSSGNASASVSLGSWGSHNVSFAPYASALGVIGKALVILSLAAAARIVLINRG